MNRTTAAVAQSCHSASRIWALLLAFAITLAAVMVCVLPQQAHAVTMTGSALTIQERDGSVTFEQGSSSDYTKIKLGNGNYFDFSTLTLPADSPITVGSTSTEADLSNAKVYANGQPLTMAGGNVGAIYGGNANWDSEGSSDITVTGGVVGALYGCGDHETSNCLSDNVSIKVTGGEIGEITAANTQVHASGSLDGSVKLVVTGGTVGTIYGLGESGQVGDTFIIIVDTEVGVLYPLGASGENRYAVQGVQLYVGPNVKQVVLDVSSGNWNGTTYSACVLSGDPFTHADPSDWTDTFDNLLIKHGSTYTLQGYLCSTTLHELSIMRDDVPDVFDGIEVGANESLVISSEAQMNCFRGDCEISSAGHIDNYGTIASSIQSSGVVHNYGTIESTSLLGGGEIYNYGTVSEIAEGEGDPVLKRVLDTSGLEGFVLNDGAQSDLVNLRGGDNSNTFEQPLGFELEVAEGRVWPADDAYELVRKGCSTDDPDTESSIEYKSLDLIEASALSSASTSRKANAFAVNSPAQDSSTGEVVFYSQAFTDALYLSAYAPLDIRDATIELSRTEYTYDGTEKKPDVTVKVGDQTAEEGKDYTLSFGDTVNAGEVTVTVTSTGRDAYETTATYTIKPVDISGMMFNANDTALYER